MRRKWCWVGLLLLGQKVVSVSCLHDNGGRDTVVLDINTTHSPFATSDGGEAGLMYDAGFMFKIPIFTDAVFLQRLKALSLGGGQVIRIGGGRQICTAYNVTGKLQELPKDWHAVRKYCGGKVNVLNATLWDAMLDAMESVNASIVFGIGSGIGRPWNVSGPWDPAPSGLLELLDYTASRKGRVHTWELGNEPYKYKFGYNIPGEVLAADCARVRAAVHAAATKHGIPPANVACPDYECLDQPPGLEAAESDSEVKGSFWKTVDEFVAPATSGTNPVDALTLHWYPIHSKHPNISSYALDPTRLDKFSDVFRRFPQAADKGWHGEVWAGETASVQNGGKDGISNAWASTLWTYDQLGQQGNVGIARMLKECIACANYNMLNITTYAPNPDFFTTILWRKVVGPKVLSIRGQEQKGSVLRTYARCSRRGDRWVVAIALNLGNATLSIAVPSPSASLARAGAGPQQMLYYLAPGDDQLLSSKLVALNGKVLALSSTGELPEMAANTSAQGTPVALPPFTAVLVEYHDDAASACATSANHPRVQSGSLADEREQQGAVITV